MSYTQLGEDALRTLRVCDMNEDEKPREKALRQGVHDLADHELLAIILGGGLPGMSVVDLARKMLQDCGGDLSRVARMSIDEMKRKYKGVGDAKAVSLASAFELGVRARTRAAVPDRVIRRSQDIYDMMRGRLELCDWEEFWILTLTRANTVRHQICLSQGGTASTVVDVKLVLKRAVDVLADGIVLIHNHPSGATVASPQDDRLTQRICEGAKIIDIRVLDHVIIGRDSYYSYADQGKLP